MWTFKLENNYLDGDNPRMGILMEQYSLNEINAAHKPQQNSWTVGVWQRYALQCKRHMNFNLENTTWIGTVSETETPDLINNNNNAKRDYLLRGENKYDIPRSRTLYQHEWQRCSTLTASLVKYHLLLLLTLIMGGNAICGYLGCIVYSRKHTNIQTYESHKRFECTNVWITQRFSHICMSCAPRIR